MQRLVDRLRHAVEDFVEQRDDLLLVPACSDADAAIVAKVLRDVEQASGTDVFLIFTDDFTLPGAYVSVIGERLREEHRMACEALAEEGREPLPPLPPELFDARQEPATRLYAGMAFARDLLPAGGGHRVVWAMCPQRIVDREAWLQLVSAFAPHQGVQPWMRNLRLVFRDEPRTAEFAPSLTVIPRVRVESVDFGPAALQESLRVEMEDETRPLEARMQSLLMLAMLDNAHGRTEEAVAGFTTLLGHYQQTKNLPMQALVINAFGDMARKAGDVEGAQHWYECALLPAAEANDAMMLATVVRNLATLAYDRAEFGLAEQYFVQLDRLAGHMLSPHLKVDALQWLGLSQERQGRLHGAVGSWESAATLAREMGDTSDAHRVTLSHLQRVYAQLGLQDRLAVVNAELAHLARRPALTTRSLAEVP